MGTGIDINRYGLVAQHAYSILDATELKNADGKVQHKIVKMRNPYARDSYHGPFSDKSTLWTAAWKKQVNLKVASDGVFWIPFSKLKEVSGTY